MSGGRANSWKTHYMKNLGTRGLPFAHELTTLFKDVVATEEMTWAPSCGVLPNGHNGDDNDGYHPCLDNIVLDMEEGLGDSEDASVGATNEFDNIGLSSSQGVISQKSGEKRKRTSGAENTSKRKESASSRIAQAVNVIAETCRSRNDAISSASIGEVMAEIQKLEEVTNDLEWHARCCQLMMFKPVREMFVALQGSEDKMINWLKHAAYNPAPFMNM